MSPLSKHAIRALSAINALPRPRQIFNPGVVDRLLRSELAEIVSLPSPYDTHRGRPINHLKITEAGRSALAQAGAA